MFMLLTIAFTVLVAGLAPHFGTDSRPDFAHHPDPRQRGI